MLILLYKQCFAKCSGFGCQTGENVFVEWLEVLPWLLYAPTIQKRLNRTSHWRCAKLNCQIFGDSLQLYRICSI